MICVLLASWQMTAPWNFPPASEWNRPMEFGFEQVYDAARKISSPKRKTIDCVPYVYDDITRSYFPDFGLMLEAEDGRGVTRE